MIVLLYLLYGLAVYGIIRLVKYVHYQYGLYQAMKHLPGPEIRSPLLGNLDLFWSMLGDHCDVSKRIHARMGELCDHYGREHGFFRLWLGPFTPWIVVCDAKLAKKVLSSKFHADKASYYRLIAHFFTGGSLIAASASRAARDRKVFKEHFTLKYLQSYIPKQEKHLKNMVEHIEECIDKHGGVLADVSKLVSTLIYDTVGDNLFSSQFNAIKTGTEPPSVVGIRELIPLFGIAFVQPWRYVWTNRTVFLLVNTLNHAFFRFTLPAFKSVVKYHTSVGKIVKQRYRQLAGGEENKVDLSQIDRDKPSLLDCLLVSRFFSPKVKPKGSSIYKVLWHMNMFIVAGHDTSTTSISWMLYMLAHHREAQAKAREEIDEFLASGEQPNQFNLKRLTYLECCIKETLRLYPVAPFQGRYGTQPLPVTDNISLPGGVDFTVFFDYVHTQEKYFPSPTQFIPERFLESNNADHLEELTANQAIMPFSLGERTCLGKQYAMTQMKLFFITLLSKYEIQALDSIGDVPNDHYFLTRPPQISVKIVRRQKEN